MSLEGFDKFCDDNKIADDEVPMAFAAWLSGETGWDGKMQKASCEHEDTVLTYSRPWRRLFRKTLHIRCLSCQMDLPEMLLHHSNLREGPW